jgi:quercetin dioxygenase-like cupin family protein
MKAGTVLSLVGDVYTVKASGEQTGSAYALFDAVVPPGGGPPPHLHHREDEAFYVLEGELEFHTAEGSFPAGPGELVHLPKGRKHGFRNAGAAPARTLIWVVPAGLEEFFSAVGHELPDPASPAAPVTPEDIDRLLTLAPKYGLEIYPPE